MKRILSINILCLLGIHDWHYFTKRNAQKAMVITRLCSGVGCGKEQEYHGFDFK